MGFKSEEESFWAGAFGDEYVSRSSDKCHVVPNLFFFSRLLKRTQEIKSFMEFGANVGLNLEALRLLKPAAELSGVEINQSAVTELKKIDDVKVYPQSILEYVVDYKRDFVFTRGVLIHINPDFLSKVYDLLYQSANRYICVVEYYNPVPVAISYRGHADKIFKRDFAGEILDKYRDLRLIDYGFVYHRDNPFPQDDVNWFLMEK